MQRKPRKVINTRSYGKTKRKPKQKKLMRTKVDRFMSFHRD